MTEVRLSLPGISGKVSGSMGNTDWKKLLLDESLGCQCVGVPLQHPVMKNPISSVRDTLGENGPETIYHQIYIICVRSRLPFGDVAG